MFSRFPILLILFITNTQLSPGQVGQTGDRNYFDIHLSPGVSAYGGNLRGINTHRSFFGLALKAGIGYVFTEELSVGLDYRVADYPRTERPSVGSYTRKHTVNLCVNYVFLSYRDFASYFHGGVGMTFFGLYDDPHMFKPTFSPVLGGGFQLKLDDRFYLFVEGKLDIMFDDDALDEISAGGRGMDGIGFLGLGVRMRLF